MSRPHFWLANGSSPAVLHVLKLRLLPAFLPLHYCLECRDDVQHTGRRINWGTWAVCRDDWAFGGTGNPKQGASYDPAPGQTHYLHDVGLSCAWRGDVVNTCVVTKHQCIYTLLQCWSSMSTAGRCDHDCGNKTQPSAKGS